MSGPITVVIMGEPVTALLSAAAIRAAQAIAEGYDEAAHLHEQHEASMREQSAAQSAARLQGREALENEARATEARFEKLVALSEKLGVADRVRATRPVRPGIGDEIALGSYARGLKGLAYYFKATVTTE